MALHPRFDKARVVVVGSSAMDVTARVDRFPELGESVRGTSVKASPGGKGANAASMAARLGAEVELISAVGDDLYGDELLRTLQVLNVGTDSVVRLAGQTGMGHIQVAADGNNKIVSCAGVNANVGPEVVEAARANIVRADVVVGQLVLNQEATRLAFALAKASGATTILNPSPMVPVLEGLRELVDVLIVNETEATFLSGGAVEDLSSAATVAKSLVGSWGDVVIVTCGDKGVVAVTAEDVIALRAHEVEMIEASGAGDAFSGGLAAALGAGFELAAALEVGSACGALSATRAGRGAAQPSLDEVSLLRGGTEDLRVE